MPTSPDSKHPFRAVAGRIGLLLAFLTTLAGAVEVDVFFVGGQSNAKTQFRDGIQSALIASGRFPNMQVVWVNHSGTAIGSWYNNGRQVYYKSDLYDPSSTVKGLLEDACDNITAAGNTYRIRGFFWFQGETDRTSSSTYAAKFNGMMSQLATDLNQGNPVPFGMTLIDYNPNVVPFPLTQAEVDGVNALRVVQRNLAEVSPVGSYADTRGYSRSDIWHVLYLNGPPNTLSTFGTALGNAFLATQFPLYWDTNGTVAGFGSASGTWGTNSFWNSDSNGASGTFSSATTTNNTVYFGNGATGLGSGTVNVGSVSSGDITFASGSGDIVLAGGTITFAAAATLTTNNSLVTISSTLTGATTSLTKAGSGTLVLTGANNRTGTTAINSGSLLLGTGGSIGNSPTTVAANATLGSSTTSTRGIGAATTYATGAKASFTAVGGGSSTLGKISVTGNLTMNANPISINVTSAALAVGDYPLLECSGTLANTGSFGAPVITGIPLSGTVASVVVNAGAGGSIVLRITLPGDPTTTTLTRTSGASPSTYGDSLTFSAVVTPDPGDGATVTFKRNGVTFGTTTTTSGVANLTTGNLPASGGSPFAVTADFAGNVVYDASSGSLIGGQQVNPYPLTLTGATAQNKLYDGNTQATITSGTLSATINGDVITANTGTFAQATVGTGIPVTVNLSGSATGNYILSQPGLTANIEVPPTPTWTNPAGGLWDTAGNWVSNNIGTGSGVMADFSTLDLTGDTTVNLNSPRTIGNLLFSDTDPTSAASWILSNNGNSANTLTLAGTTPTVTVNPLGTGKTVTLNAIVAGSSGLLKAGSGTLALAKANTYTGTTTLGLGTLSFTTNQTLTGGLTFGTADGSSTASTLELIDANATFAGTLTIKTNNPANNHIVIGSGRILTTNSNVMIGTAAVSGNTNLLVAGDIDGNGAWTVTKTGGTFEVGGGDNSGTISNVATLDMSYLGTFTANLGTTGIFRVGEYSTGAASGSSSVILANTTTITADALNIGHNSAGSNSVQSLKLGIGTQTLNTNTINVGLTTQFERSGGSIMFNDAAGTVKVRAANGTGAAALNMHKSGTTTGGTIINTFDVTGHPSDLLFSTVDMMNILSPGGAASSAYSSTFSFDEGSMIMSSLKIGTRASGSVGAAVPSATVNIGGSDNHPNTATLGAVTMATASNATGGITGQLNIAGSATTVGITSLTVANNTSTGATATGIVNISNGTTTVTGGITLAARSSGGTANGTLNLTGGSVTLGGNIATTGTGGTGTTTLNLDGGTLDMANSAIGGAGQLITQLNFKSGTLKNVSQINNGAGLTKITAGTLILSGTNNYTGGTTINAGTLALDSTGTINSSPSITIAAGAKLDTTAKSTYTLPAVLTLGVDSAGTSGKIDASGKVLVISSAAVTLNVSGTLTAPAYVLATYGSKTGAAFASVTAVPGYTIDYGYNGGTQIALVQTSAFTFWINTNYPDLADKTAGGDPDLDGVSNLLEYTLNGNPSISDSSVLPDLDASGSNFDFSYNRLAAAATATTQTFQYGGAPGEWTDIVVPSSSGSVGESTITITNSGTTELVVIRLAKSVAGSGLRLFGRLKVTQP